MLISSERSNAVLPIIPRREIVFNPKDVLQRTLLAIGCGTLGVNIGAIILIKRFRHKEPTRRDFIKYLGGFGVTGAIGGFITSVEGR